ncbi:hypothetical protein G9A89_006078 [Geosiphon pyriformis]|nr:hypothetical protein G9A89_006078 [Geosiphon pyriformis]
MNRFHLIFTLFIVAIYSEISINAGTVLSTRNDFETKVDPRTLKFISSIQDVPLTLLEPVDLNASDLIFEHEIHPIDIEECRISLTNLIPISDIEMDPSSDIVKDVTAAQEFGRRRRRGRERIYGMRNDQERRRRRRRRRRRPSHQGRRRHRFSESS